MRRALVFSLMLLLAAAAADGKRKRSKPPDIEVLESIARRGPDIVTLDGRIRNTGTKPIQRLVLQFDFLATENNVVTRQSGEIDNEVLPPGDEAAFHVQLEDPPRAVMYRISAVDAHGRNLRISNAGPFLIQ